MVKVSQIISYLRVIYHLLVILYDVISVKYQQLFKVFNLLNGSLSIADELEVKLLTYFLRFIPGIPPDIFELIEYVSYHRFAIERPI